MLFAQIKENLSESLNEDMMFHSNLFMALFISTTVFYEILMTFSFLNPWNQFYSVLQEWSIVGYILFMKQGTLAQSTHAADEKHMIELMWSTLSHHSRTSIFSFAFKNCTGFSFSAGDICWTIWCLKSLETSKERGWKTNSDSKLSLCLARLVANLS